MPEIQVGFHTIQSHRLKVARIQLRDWLILVLLAVIELVLYIINPFHCLVRKEWMTDLKYPMQGITVPFWAVPMIAVMLPILMFVLYYLYRRDVYDVHHAIIGLLFSVFITGVITDAIKDAVGRPRPDFFWCCFPDGRPSYDRVIGDVLCHGEKSIIKEGYKSFPSGIHHVGSFAGLGFLSWYLSGKIRAFDRREHVAKLSIVFLPLLTATLIGISVVNDYWHHWQDAFVRGFLGLVVASICYLQFFPLPYDAGGWGPHAYSRMLEESISSAPQPQASCIPIHTTEVESGFALPVNGGNSRIGDGFQTQDMHICCHLKTVETGMQFCFSHHVHAFPMVHVNTP